MIRTLRRYAAFAAAEMQSLLAYRSGFVLAIVTNSISLLVQLCVWRAIYASGGRVLAGYSFAEMTSYVLVSNALYIALDNRVDDDIAADVMRGDIVVHFTRPVSYLGAKLFSSLPVMLTNLILVAFPVCLLAACTFGLRAPRLADCPLFVVSACLSLTIGFAVNALVGALAFVTTNIWGARLIKSALIGMLSGYVIPLSFLSSGLRQVTALLPFQSLINTPVNVFLGHYHDPAELASAVGQQALWAVVLGAAGAGLWRNLAGRLEMNGG